MAVVSQWGDYSRDAGKKTNLPRGFVFFVLDMAARREAAVNTRWSNGGRDRRLQNLKSVHSLKRDCFKCFNLLVIIMLLFVLCRII